MNENLDFTHKLNRLVEQTKALKARYASIALYGYGTVGRMLAPMLRDRLVAIVDRTATGLESFDDIPVQTPDTLSRSGAECVVVTVLGREREVERYLRDTLAWHKDVHVYDLGSRITAVPAFTEADSSRLASLRGRFVNKRCVIVGNGPSLNRCDLSRLRTEFTFGVNGIFYKTEEMGFMPSFYVVEDSHVIDDNIQAINRYDCEYKFFPAIYRKKVAAADNVYFFDYDCGFYRNTSEHFGRPRFSFDVHRSVFAGQTVTYTNMQLAVYLGFTEIYLVGVDFDYKVPHTTEIIGDTYISHEDDPNHFHPAYFGKGKKWHDPKLDRVLMNYQHARAVLEPLGVKVLNATKGGRLEAFPRVDYDEVFRGEG